MELTRAPFESLASCRVVEHHYGLGGGEMPTKVMVRIETTGSEDEDFHTGQFAAVRVDSGKWRFSQEDPYELDGVAWSAGPWKSGIELRDQRDVEKQMLMDQVRGSIVAERRAGERIRQAVGSLRAMHLATWEEIGLLAGISGQAAYQRYGKSRTAR